jgi:hypothetical protein
MCSLPSAALECQGSETNGPQTGCKCAGGKHDGKVNIQQKIFLPQVITSLDRLCGIVVSVEDYKHRGPGFDSRALRICLRELGLERGPLSLVIG